MSAQGRRSEAMQAAAAAGQGHQNYAGEFISNNRASQSVGDVGAAWNVNPPERGRGRGYYRDSQVSRRRSLQNREAAAQGRPMPDNGTIVPQRWTDPVGAERQRDERAQTETRRNAEYAFGSLAHQENVDQGELTQRFGEKNRTAGTFKPNTEPRQLAFDDLTDLRHHGNFKAVQDSAYQLRREQFGKDEPVELEDHEYPRRPAITRQGSFDDIVEERGPDKAAGENWLDHDNELAAWRGLESNEGDESDAARSRGARPLFDRTVDEAKRRNVNLSAFQFQVSPSMGEYDEHEVRAIDPKTGSTEGRLSWKPRKQEIPDFYDEHYGHDGADSYSCEECGTDEDMHNEYWRDHGYGGEAEDSREISWVGVDEAHRGKEVATGLWDIANEHPAFNGEKPKHSSNRSSAGYAWSKYVGGEEMERTAGFHQRY